MSCSYMTRYGECSGFGWGEQRVFPIGSIKCIAKKKTIMDFLGERHRPREKRFMKGELNEANEKIDTYFTLSDYCTSVFV